MSKKAFHIVWAFDWLNFSPFCLRPILNMVLYQLAHCSGDGMNVGKARSISQHDNDARLSLSAPFSSLNLIA